MPRKKAQVESALQNRGFIKTEGDHHFFVYFTIDGKKTTIRTKTSHTPKMKDIPDNLLAQMAKQCRISKSEFLDLVDCSMDQSDYESLLKKRDQLG